jgi:hypothetical protein
MQCYPAKTDAPRQVPLAVVQLDYQTTHDLIKILSDIRFRLLSIVPPLSTIGVTLVSTQAFGIFSPFNTFMVGLMGFFTILGIVLYDLRNSGLYNAAVHRAKVLEKVMGCVRYGTEIIEVTDLDRKRSDQTIPIDAVGLTAVRFRPQEPGGAHYQRAISFLRFLGFEVSHDPALALIYSVLLGAWVFPIAKGALVLTGLLLQRSGMHSWTNGTGLATSAASFLITIVGAYAFWRALTAADLPRVVTALYSPTKDALDEPPWRPDFLIASRDAFNEKPSWTRKLHLIRHKNDPRLFKLVLRWVRQALT